MFDSSEVDAVFLSVPHHLHGAFGIRALEAGKHVVWKKPMALTPDECDAMMAAARDNRRAISVCYCQRFEPKVRRARELIIAGAVGPLLNTRMSLTIGRSSDYWSGGLTGRVQTDWRRHRATAGGGVLIMNACHLLDYMTWLAGEEIVEVASCSANLVQGGDIEDTISMSYRYRSGALGTLDVTNAATGPALHEMRLTGRDGHLVVAPSLRLWSTRVVDGYDARNWHTVRGLPRSAERRQFFEAFAAAVMDDLPLPVLAEEARAVQAVIDAAYESAATGRTAAVRTFGHHKSAPLTSVTVPSYAMSPDGTNR